MNRTISYGLVLGAVLGGCATSPSSEPSRAPARFFMNSSTKSEERPVWTKGSPTWHDDKAHFLNARYALRWDEKKELCFRRARLDAKEILLNKLADSIERTLNQSNLPISDRAKTIIWNARSGKFGGRLSGLKLEKKHFEKYHFRRTIRVECFVLASVSTEDYGRFLRALIKSVAKVDKTIRRAWLKKEIDFTAKPKLAGLKSKRRFRKYFELAESHLPGPFQFGELVLLENTKESVLNQEKSVTRRNLVEVAQSFAGETFRISGGDGAREDFDGAAFVAQLYLTVGMNLPTPSETLFGAEIGKPVPPHKLQPGDLVFFDGLLGRGRVGQVGMALGGGLFVAAVGHSGRVKVEFMNGAFWKQKYLGARRIPMPDKPEPKPEKPESKEAGASDRNVASSESSKGPEAK